MLARIRIGPRLTIGFAVIVALMSAVAVIAVFGLHSLNANLTRIVEGRHAKTEHLHTMLEEINAVSIAVRNALLAADDEARQPHLKRVAAGREALSGMLAKLDQFTPEDAKGKAFQQAVQDDNAAYTIEIVKVSRALAAGKSEMAARFMQEGLQPKFEKYMATLRALNQYEAELMRGAQQNAAASYTNGRLWIGGVLMLAVLLTGVLAVVLTRSIVRPLRAAGELASAIAEGKLSTHIEVTGRDETAALLRSLESMQGRLAGILGDVKVASEAIHTAAREMAAGNSDLSRRTEQQAASLERTSSSMRDLAQTVSTNAENAVQANELAGAASDVAVKGKRVVSEVVGTMGSIDDSSKKIADIIGVIDSIAFQTNILALNAAVEAARAGEMGRGFAVVATEVRTLAQRSADAAKQIKALISDSVAKVQNGSRLVAQAGDTMDEIVNSVNRVTHIMSDIAAASQHQTLGIGQVNDAVTQMDHMTQQNAALVEEAAAAAESMQEQADQLRAEVAVFDLGRRVKRKVPVTTPLEVKRTEGRAGWMAKLAHALRIRRQDKNPSAISTDEHPRVERTPVARAPRSAAAH